MLQLDAEVVDADLVRIAGTGPYNKSLGKKLNNSSRIFRYIIETKQSKVVVKTRSDPICEGCSNHDNCRETAFLGVPIMLDDRCIGVVSLVAFNQESGDRIKNNIQLFLDYIEHISQLVVIKVSEAKKNGSNLDEVFSNLINNMDQGVLVLDDANRVLHGNPQALDILNISHSELALIEVNIQPLLPHNNKLKGPEQHIVTLGECQELVVGQFHVIANKQLFLMSFHQPNTSITADDTPASPFSNIIGESNKMLQLKTLIARVAKSPSSILISGESGTGKEVFAQAIHKYSDRSEQNFVAINCAAIPEQLLESELFGYVKGAFTGALTKGKVGLIQAANNGTLFLDEIGDMSMTLQSKLLRVLEEREVMPLGSNASTPVNIRIISATNRNFAEMIAANEFREDLYYRLNVIPLYLPALREREGDIELLVYYFLDRHSQAIGTCYPGITEEVINSLNAYHWPGNIRELSNLVEYLVNIVPSGDQIDIDLLPPYFDTPQESCTPMVSINDDNVSLEEMERIKIEDSINRLGNRKLVAKELGIGVATLYRKLKKYRLSC
ncbi:putative sigma54 specific transcriptional regulator [Shewanella halifaxensis HAW-EB4]|uniref:Sigma54 specific transcriptional regulator n=1 Tax=Shewanella halifaxensis (strain HAW-EB4) TaxID=458817 RepID=B0TS74_SHEHH|nr:sigma 54-interacting transcriptional regulator [Shewanella halifaxensis]ABZ75209.1 putative sigma54 specific transcriptional regulator [Shewanella halifaxensis HAW-EB4]